MSTAQLLNGKVLPAQQHKQDEHVNKHASWGWRGVQLVYHVLALSGFAYVWWWHTTPAAAFLPGVRGFGWFFRYLTFFSFTLQLLSFALCTLADLTQNGVLATCADDLCCAMFPMANVVTIMYFGVKSSTADAVEGGDTVRPWWLGMSVHVLNAVAAWLELAISRPRSFSRRAERLSAVVVVTYIVWVLVCRHFNGVFPYPFLNKMPFPTGFIIMAAISVTVFVIMFRIGKFLFRSSASGRSAAAAATKKQRVD